VKEKVITFDIWDLDRTESGTILRKLNYVGSNVFLLFFSIDKPESFKNIKEIWVPELNHYCPHVPIILVGSKIDTRNDILLKDKSNLIKTSEGIEMAKSLNCVAYYEISSLKGDGIEGLLELILSVSLFHPKKKNNCLLQ
jgi:small GTP-binding protein